MQLLLTSSIVLSILSVVTEIKPQVTYHMAVITYVALGFYCIAFILAYLVPLYVPMRKINIAISISCVLISTITAFALQIAGCVYMAPRNNSPSNYHYVDEGFAFGLASAVVDFINFAVFFMLFCGLAAEREPEVDSSSEDFDKPKRRYDFLPLIICG